MYYEQFLNEVERGKLGLNKGLPTGLDRLNKIIGGLQKETYYLIGGEPGTGKTAFVDQAFVIEPILYLLANKQLNTKLKIFYESYEISKLRKIAKWVALFIYRDKGIITSINEILSRGDYKITEKIESLLPGYKDIFDEIFLNSVEINDYKENPTGIYKRVKNYMEKNGNWRNVEVKDKRGSIIRQKIYTPNNPDEYVLLIVDHIGLLRRERGYNKKENIDKLSEYVVELRNSYGISPIFVSQFNRNLADIDRQRFKEVQPQMDDFKDTGNCAEDANIVLAGFNPARYNISKYADYSVRRINPRFRTAHILKNRDDTDMARIALNFLGECGYFRELPKAENMQEKDYKIAKEFLTIKGNLWQ